MVCFRYIIVNTPHTGDNDDDDDDDDDDNNNNNIVAACSPKQYLFSKAPPFRTADFSLILFRLPCTYVPKSARLPRFVSVVPGHDTALY